jgi:hypothetical protein
MDCADYRQAFCSHEKDSPMHVTAIVLVILHVLSGVFWAGTTFALTRLSGDQETVLFRPQMGAALIAILTGASLWFLFHRGSEGMQEHVLGVGIIFALIAAAIQGMTHARRRRLAGTSHNGPALGQRLAAACLAVTVACMAAARYI